MFNNPEHVIEYQNDWVKIKKSKDNFYYLERKGKNSISILLYNDNGEILVRMQPMCAVEVLGDSTTQLAPCTITGSIDEGEDYIQTAIREAKEEAGYGVEDMIEETGSYIVSTQCNEICFTYIANVEGITPEEPQTDGGYHESISYNMWMKLEDAYKLPNIYGGLLIQLKQVENKLKDREIIEMFNNILGFPDNEFNPDEIKDIQETIDKRMSFTDIVRELMHSWKEKGTIHNRPIDSEEEARKVALGIAYSIKGEKQS